jgi:hypothetical protein
MRVLLDESLPRDLGRDLTGHEVRTVRQAGWAGLANGDLLRRAAGQFDVLVTGDRTTTVMAGLRSSEANESGLRPFRNGDRERALAALR